MSIDKRLNRLAVESGDFAALLYVWMIPHAADDTTLNGDIEEFMATVIPMRRDKTIADVAHALDAMHTLGLIVWDKARNLIRFPSSAFYAHQTYIRADNRVEDWPAPQNTEERRETPEKAVSFSLSLSSSLSPSSSSSDVAAPAATAPRKRAKREFRPLTDEQRCAIDQEFKDIPNLEEEITFALGHDAHGKCSDENLYLRRWLRRTRDDLLRRGPLPPRNGHAITQGPARKEQWAGAERGAPNPYSLDELRKRPNFLEVGDDDDGAEAETGAGDPRVGTAGR